MKRTRIVVIALLWLLAFYGCNRGDKIPLDSIDVDIDIQRFEKSLFSINLDSIDTEAARLTDEYPQFFNLFTEGIIGIGNTDDPNFSSYLKGFLTDETVSETYAQVSETFSDIEWLNIEITNAFKRYKYYFPNNIVPKVYTFVSGFNSSVIIADSLVAFGCDRYLGRDCEYYSMLGIPKYLQYNMHPKKIPSDVMHSWLFGEFVFNDSIDNLVNNMIYDGGLMYATKKLLPTQSDSLLFGFTPDQMKWCKNNESHMWAYLVEHKLLFTSETFTINQFVNNAPFTKGFPTESPGKAAVWLGYRIVQKFMDRNKDYSLEQLMNETNYQHILNEARYNP
ncbi:MAG: hypothetical protein PHD00_12060 [Bacteroidales bacterium]|nr:hypothetical protein [Bacteroidales bacterium]MDD4673235.1 hypothetical protein [Bacteroidales bacterium]MDY0348043.1 hypothetical protein [Tenuifilaceae bacterium]